MLELILDKRKDWDYVQLKIFDVAIGTMASQQQHRHGLLLARASFYPVGWCLDSPSTRTIPLTLNSQTPPSVDDDCYDSLADFASFSPTKVRYVVNMCRDERLRNIVQNKASYRTYST